MIPRTGARAPVIVNRLGDLLDNATKYTGHVNAYEAWVQRLEWLLRECFVDAPVERLHTERFWRLITGDLHRTQQHEMIRLEVAQQKEWLDAVLGSVKAMVELFADASEMLGVVDTNVLLHHKPLVEIDWKKVLGSDAIRLVVPLAVVDEIDVKKAAKSNTLSGRARTRARLLDEHLANGGVVRPGVAVQTVGFADLDPEAKRHPPARVDVEVLDVCQSLSAFAGAERVVLVTGDLGMKVRAADREIALKEMPAADYQPLGGSDDG